GQFAFGANPQSFPELIVDRALEIPEAWGSFSALTITVGQLIVMGVTVVLLFAMRYIVLHTRMGMAMRALSFNPVAASLMGINNDVVISFTFGLGSALAAAAGILISIQQPSILHERTITPSTRTVLPAYFDGAARTFARASSSGTAV
ncbi:MAG: hypothetical protein V4710_04115, partial [Verrucomicrobiota bacterium]